MQSIVSAGFRPVVVRFDTFIRTRPADEVSRIAHILGRWTSVRILCRTSSQQPAHEKSHEFELLKHFPQLPFDKNKSLMHRVRIDSESILPRQLPSRAVSTTKSRLAYESDRKQRIPAEFATVGANGRLLHQCHGSGPTAIVSETRLPNRCLLLVNAMLSIPHQQRNRIDQLHSYLYKRTSSSLFAAFLAWI